MADSLESESAATLLSMKDGSLNSKQKAPPVVSRNPPRLRKRNRRIFNDYEDTSYTLSRSSARKSARIASPVSQKTDDPEWTPEKRPGGRNIKKEPPPPVVLPDKRVIQKVGIRLRNLLKLPKAHRWVCYEWFYSNIDQPLFQGDNEFCAYLKQSFPLLKTRKLTRVQWCKIRRIMGKPRRCSPSFFEEEIRSLHERRNNIRQVQQRKVLTADNFSNLPADIPLPLVIGTKVTARLRKPQDGLFEGSIDAVDTQTATYRTKFDRSGLGTHSVPDFEVLSIDPPETMPKASFLQRQRPRHIFYVTPPRPIPYTQGARLENDPLLGGSPLRPGLSGGDETSTVGGFPVDFLTLMVQLSKILSLKREKIDKLRELNTQAEKMTSYGQPILPEFKKRYALLIMEFEVLNKDLQESLEGILAYCEKMAPEQGLQFVIQPQAIRNKCLEEARELMERCAPARAVSTPSSSPSFSPSPAGSKVKDLVAKLTSIMLQVKNLAQGDLNSFELKSLGEALADIQNGLDSRNVGVFQNKVQIHINHIQNGLSQLGNLHAFTSSSQDVSV
ncbi:protein lin-9 homolog isoform X1 [Ixodes scapularis]|uniref:protein lin-9 homolog isoform X1 n=1 Tax=Ixodes scapularis TaxID=6945 RepID=UPI001C38CAF0|nr:protein lin-9 homolog isoform X1 [Ixodes scapularis]